MKFNPRDLTKSTKKDLVMLAKKASIKKYSTMKRAELIKSLSVAAADVRPANKKVRKVKVRQIKIKKKVETSIQEPVSTKPDIIKNVYVSTQDEITVSKFAVAVNTAQETLPHESDGIPREYGVNRIVLMVRDPYWLHTYWEVTPEQVMLVRAAIPAEYHNQTRLVLRVMDITDTDPYQPHYSNYIDVMLESRNWYVNVSSSDRLYCIEIGYLCPDGRFYALARSNAVRTPREGMSNVFDERWMSIEDFDKLYALSGGIGVGLSSGELAGVLGQRAMKEALSSGASQQEIPEKTQKDFFLSTDTELVLYGKTTPGSKINIGGIEKKAGQDGSFSVRFQLTKGEHIIPLKAYSADGKQVQDASIKINRDNS